MKPLTHALTAFSLLLSSISPAPAAPPPIATDQGNPPGRVGRLARVSGMVSFHTADQMVWSPATLNYPITTGNALWTEPPAEALVEVSGNRLAMDGATELDIATLDDHALVASTPQGEVYLNLRQVPGGDSYTIQTPRAAVQITAAGRYEVAAGDSDHPTTITVVEGAAQVAGTNIALQVGAGQTASIDGTTDYKGVVGPIRQDAFLTKMLAQERPAPRTGVAVPPVVVQMTGSEDLDQYGAWSDTPQNGVVWYPRVDSGWAPYRHGHWAYVAPWGWTWVDDSAWGFAPFHYGRWIETDDRWGWVPAEPAVAAYPAPVYAPALVSWVDIGAAVAVGAAAGALLSGGGRSVGWVPLGPNEPYYPPYSRSLNYVRAMNGPSVRNVTQVINNVNIQGGVNNRTVVQNFINRGGATVVPAAVMTGSAPVAAAARPLAPQQFTQLRAQAQAPVSPVATTVGATPAVARQFNFTPAATAHAAAGPAINPAAFHAAPARAAAAFVPSLRPANVAVTPATGPEARPAEPVRPAATIAPAEPAKVAPSGAPAAAPEARPAEPVRPAPPAPSAEPARAAPASGPAVARSGLPADHPPVAARAAEPPPAIAAARPAPLASVQRPVPAVVTPHPAAALAPATPPRPPAAMAPRPAQVARLPQPRPMSAARPAPPPRPAPPHAAPAPRPAPPHHAGHEKPR